MVIRRIIDILDSSSNFNLAHMGRGDYLFLGFDLGGYFGNGPGSYSNIYQLKGYDYETLPAKQINIAQSSSLLAESGIFGLAITLFTYLVFITSFFRQFLYKICASIFFLLCAFYSAVLSNESHAFLLVLIFVYMSILAKKHKTRLIK